MLVSGLISKAYKESHAHYLLANISMIAKQLKNNEMIMNVQQLIQTWYIIRNLLPEEKRTFKDIEVN